MKTQKLIKLLYASTIVLVFVSCKKLNKEETTVNFHLYNPVTNEGYENITVKVIEQRDVTKPFQLSNEYETKVIWEGKTNFEGKAKYSFRAYKNDKYTYWHTIDESSITGKKIERQPENGPENKNSINENNYLISEYVNLVEWYKNNNCFDVNDRCRIRIKNIAIGENWGSWYPLTSDGYIGCYEYLSSVQSHSQAIWMVEYEVKRNNVITNFIDTLYLTGQNGIDTLKYFY